MAKKNNKKKNRNEEMELETSYKKTVGKYASKKGARKQGNGFVVAICILIPLLVLVGLAWFFLSEENDNGKILNNVSIAGVNVGGMTPEEAMEAVDSVVLGAMKSRPMVVSVLDEKLELTPEVSGISLDVEAAVDAAYALGRTGTPAERKEQRLKASTMGIETDISEYLTVNADAIREALNSLNIASSGSLVQSTWEVTGEKPDLHGAEAPAQTQTLVVTMGQPEYHYDQNTVVEDILTAYKTGVFDVTCNCDSVLPDPIDLDAVYEEYCTAASDAVMDEKTFEVTPHTYGHAFDLVAAKQAVEEADFGQRLEFPFQLTTPQKFESELSDLLFRDVLSSYESFQASNSDRATNMKIACEAINGTVLLPGEVFSFNDTVGERTAAKGYKPAPSYEGGKTILTYGGGVCQPSSTIYYCALLADLEIVERECHSYPSYYVPWGMDATINWLTLDFKFRNNTEYPLRIDASADSKGTVSVALVGTEVRDTYVKMEYEIVGYYPHETKEIHFTEENNPNGYYDGQVITSPVDGYKVITYRCRYDRQTDELISRNKEAESIYSRRDKEVAVLDRPVTEPPATEPPATEPVPVLPPDDSQDPPVTPPADSTTPDPIAPGTSEETE